MLALLRAVGLIRSTPAAGLRIAQRVEEIAPAFLLGLRLAPQHHGHADVIGVAADRPAVLAEHAELADEIVAELRTLDVEQVAGVGVLRDQPQRLLLAAELQLGLEQVVHVGHRVHGELDVDDRADHSGDAADAALALGLYGLVNSRSHCSHSLPALASARALTPPTISLISWVIPA